MFQAEEKAPATSEANDDADDAKPAEDVTEANVTEDTPVAGSDVPPTEEEVHTEGERDVVTASPQEAAEGEVTAEDAGDNVKFFLTEEGGGAAVSAQDGEAGEVDEADEADEAEATQERKSHGGDRLSSAGSAKSKGKRTVTFSDENVAETKDVDTPATDAGVAERDGGPSSKPESSLSQNEAGPGIEAQDTDVDDFEQGQAHVEPLKVIVTHIERSMGAPAPKESEDEVIAEDP